MQTCSDMEMYSQKKSNIDYSILRTVLIFFLVFFSFSYLYHIARNTWVETLVIDTITVAPSAFLINKIEPDEMVHAVEHRLISSNARLSVLNGCEGTETLFLIIAAIMAFPTRWKHRLAGLMLGIVLIYTANQFRIVGLYFTLRYEREWFSAIHGFIGPTAIITIGCLFYIWWTRWPEQTSEKLFIWKK